MCQVLIQCSLFVARQRDVGRRFKELLPELGPFPNIARVLAILFNDWEDTGGDDAMRLAEVVVNL